MRDQYWNWYVYLKYTIDYLEAYKTRKNRISNGYSAILLCASAAGITSLTIWSSVPHLWSIIVIFAQIIEAIKPVIPWFNQGPALKYILQDYDSYFSEVERFWNHIDEADDTEIEDFIHKIEVQMRNSQDRFAGDVDFPIIPACAKKADKSYKAYFEYKYDVNGG